MTLEGFWFNSVILAPKHSTNHKQKVILYNKNLTNKLSNVCFSK